MSTEDRKTYCVLLFSIWASRQGSMTTDLYVRVAFFGRANEPGQLMSIQEFRIVSSQNPSMQDILLNNNVQILYINEPEKVLRFLCCLLSATIPQNIIYVNLCFISEFSSDLTQQKVRAMSRRLCRFIASTSPAVIVKEFVSLLEPNDKTC